MGGTLPDLTLDTLDVEQPPPIAAPAGACYLPAEPKDQESAA